MPETGRNKPHGSMLEFNLVDPRLNNYYKKTILSIQLSLDGFSFAIHSSFDKELRAFRNYKFSNLISKEDLLNEIRNLLVKDDLLRLPYESIKVIYYDRKSTLLPDEFLDENQLKPILEFNQPIDDLDEIHLNSLSNCTSSLIFTVPTYFASLISDKFELVTFYNQACPLITEGVKNFNTPGKTSVLIQLNKDFFDLVIIMDGQLKLYNSFLYVDTNDLLYFILYACKQLKVTIKSSDFYLVGERSTNKNLIREMETYLKITKPTVKSISDPRKHFTQLDHSRFYSLLNLIHCE